MNFKSRLSSIRLARSWNSGTGRPNRKWGAPARWTLWSLGYFVVFSTSLSAADEKTDFFETRIRPLIVE
ncbi:MAG: hypothetical protein ACK5D7_04495, partial [Planctomycetota bacterium]